MKNFETISRTDDSKDVEKQVFVDMVCDVISYSTDESECHSISNLNSNLNLDTDKNVSHKNRNVCLNSEDDATIREERKARFRIYKFCVFMEWFKYVYSMLLLLFVTVVLHTAIFTNQSVGTKDNGLHPVLVFVIVWFMTCWLAIMEGGQGCLVGIQPLDRSSYSESHPITLRNSELIHKDDNMERFIIGRQFLVFLVIFVINMLGSSIEDASVLGLPQLVNNIFLQNGVAMILFVIVFGQLAAQINAAKCMLDFVNNKFMLYFVSYIALAIEWSGVLHSVYFFQEIFFKISRKEAHSIKNKLSLTSRIFYYVRMIISCCILVLSLAVTIESLINENTTMWKGFPSYISILMFVFLMSFVGMMDGMQIALFAVVKMPEKDLAHYPIALSNCSICFKDRNLESFLIGRQICVTLCSFVIARLISLDLSESDKNIFDVPDEFQQFFNTGFLGTIVTTVFASLIWRTIASSFPIIFLSNPLIYVVIRLCLFVEGTGLCSSSWVVARLQKQCLRYEQDEYYLSKSDAGEKESLA